MRLATLLAATLLASPLALAQDLAVERLGTYATGIFDDGGAEIAAYDAVSQRVYVVNASANELVAVDASDPASPTEAFTVDLSPYGAGANSVAVSTIEFEGVQGIKRNDTIVAVAVEADPKTGPGVVVFFDADGALLFPESGDGESPSVVPVGALPDGLAFSPDGQYLVVANEGEPSDDYAVDPEGSISVIGFSVPVSGGGVRSPDLIATLDFQAFNAGGARAAEIAADPSIRVFGPGATVAQDLEPEFVAISPDSKTAYVSLQENNALAVVDLAYDAPSIRAVVGLGVKDHALEANALDASDRDGAIAITTRRVFGLYQPDGLATAEIDGATYVFAANEGDARDYDTFSEEARVKDLALNPVTFPNAGTQADDALGRLTVTTTMGDVGDDGVYEALYAFGARSLSIHSADGARVWDSGDDVERRIAALVADGTLPQQAFGADNDENDAFDSRSDAKGPEPEGVVVGEVNGTPYAFVGLERISAVVVYDVSDPEAPVYAGFVQNRDYTVAAELASGGPNPAVGDLGPEGLVFVPSDASPTDRALLVTSNEVSGTVTFYALGVGGTSTVQTPSAPSLLRLRGAVPNPARSPRIALDLAAPADIRLVVFDALGREVARSEQRVAAGTDVRLQPEVGGLAPGVYLYTVEARAGAELVRQSGRFVLAR